MRRVNTGYVLVICGTFVLVYNILLAITSFNMGDALTAELRSTMFDVVLAVATIGVSGITVLCFYIACYMVVGIIKGSAK